MVSRPRLLERLNEGLHRNLTLISAPAGFGKTTLVSEWVTFSKRPTSWLSLDEGENDPARFLTYLVAALQTIAPHIGEGTLGVLQSPQPPPTEPMLTTLLNDLTTIPDQFILVLDDYHVLDAKLIDQALTFLVEHLPPQMHLVIATREDPPLPLARLRARGHLTELRAVDLRFTPSEAATFLNQVMGLHLSAEDAAALERRTEGWIAGLQFAALSLQGHEDAASFITSFTGSHHFVLDYLVEEVLGQQPESIQNFLLRTSILDRLCGPLCDAVLMDPAGSGRATLEYLEHANLFMVPLDNERRWYCYHHLFAELLRQRLHLSIASSPGDERWGVAELHRRASQWYEDHDLELEAFQHAVAAHDVERAARLVEGKGMPLQFRGAVIPVLHWLESLPKTVLDARPALWVMYAAASRAYTEAIALSQASGNIIINISATFGLGNVQETENQIYPAAETYRRDLQLVGGQPLPSAGEAHLGLARICYEWNDLEEASQHWRGSMSEWLTDSCSVRCFSPAYNWPRARWPARPLYSPRRIGPRASSTSWIACPRWQPPLTWRRCTNSPSARPGPPGPGRPIRSPGGAHSMASEGGGQGVAGRTAQGVGAPGGRSRGPEREGPGGATAW
jgi:ATP/maltotriose-dependent transcriptional regulator MalT